LLGAPWIHSEALAADLNRRMIPGVRFEPEKFTPNSALYKGELCEGVKIILTDRNLFQPMQMGMDIASSLEKMYPKKFEPGKMIFLTGNAATVQQLSDGDDPAKIAEGWSNGIEGFRTMRAKYLLYQ